MPGRANTELEVVPELEAIAAAAAERLRALASGDPHNAVALDEAVGQAASAAIAARLPLAAMADAERTGQARARQELGSDILRRVERAATRKRDAEREYEAAVIRAAALGLPHRDIATRAQVAHGTIRAIITRPDPASETTTPQADTADTNGSAPDAPAAA